MEEKKKYSFFEKVATGLTGKTPEQRKADAMLKNQIEQKQLASYRAEQLANADKVGKAKADWETQQQIKNIGKPKPLVNLGGWGQAQQGFDVWSFGETPAHKQVKGKIKELHSSAPKMFTLGEAMTFGENGNIGLNQVKRKIKRKKR